MLLNLEQLKKDKIKIKKYLNKSINKSNYRIIKVKDSGYTYLISISIDNNVIILDQSDKANKTNILKDFYHFVHDLDIYTGFSSLKSISKITENEIFTRYWNIEGGDDFLEEI